MDWKFILLAFAVALAFSSIGFKSFVWFLSIGYGYAVAGIGLTVFVHGLATGTLTPLLCLGSFVMAAYGVRLGTFLLVREMGNKAYKQILAKKMGKEPPIFVKIVVWIVVAALYVCQTSGLHFRLTNGTGDDALLVIGIVIMICGAVIEALADLQKSAQKAKRPHMVATEGLFKIVRCPNYFGEMLFWTGVFVSGITVYRGVLQWIVALIGYIGIVYIMVDGAKRMEKGHIARYGTNPEYLAYADSTPILIPFVPIYHL